MAQILVRELEDELVASLKVRAKERHRSLEGEIRAILREVIERERRHKDAVARIERIRAELAGRATSDSVELLREAREEREAWLDSL